MRVRVLLRLASLGVGRRLGVLRGRAVVLRLGEFTTVMEPGVTDEVAPSEATRIVPGLTEAEALGCDEVPSAS